MKRCIAAFLGICLPFAAYAVREGTPIYYQPQRSAFSGNQVVGQRTQTIHVPRQPAAQQMPGFVTPGTMNSMGTMTPAGIGFVQQPDWVISGGYTRRSADFEFQTGVNSILTWDNMIINELGLRVDKNFNLRDVPLFAFGEYRQGTIASGGMSTDYDLAPYDWSQPHIGIFTISVGGMSGDTNYMRLGIGARNVWNFAGWQFSPSFGYEIFRHNLSMHDHIYPNPGIYLPLLTDTGAYVFGDQFGDFHSVMPGTTPPSDWYQVCLSPEDIWVAVVGPNGQPIINTDGTLAMTVYNPIWGHVPWGVGPGECIIIGGDGPIIVHGTTHIYNTTWSGLFIGLEIEKQMTFTDKLRFYFQLGMPNYHAEGVWPNRTDWQQNPSFIDAGSNGAYSYHAEMEYLYQISERMQLSLRADTNFFYVGQIPGELYVAGFSMFLIDPSTGYYFVDNSGMPIFEVVEPHTVKINDSLKHARWRSFGLHLGVRYAF